LQPSIPHLTRSSCIAACNGMGLPEVEGDKTAEVQTEEGKLHMFVAVDRTSKFAFAELHPRATRTIANGFLDNLIKAVPYKIHTVFTDNGIQFTKREGTEAYWTIPFDRLCDALGIEHRLTKINHPWTNGQVKRMNRTIKEATLKRYYYQSHDHLRQHLHTFLTAYNFAKCLKTLKGLTSNISAKSGQHSPHASL
jgi:transposase InsO family protein